MPNQATQDQQTQDQQTLYVEVLRQWLHTTVCMLVADESSVRVEAVVGEGTALLSLGVGAGDAGKVLGKKGCIAEALRLILTAQGMEHGIRPHLDVLVSKRVSKLQPKRKLTRERTRSA